MSERADEMSRTSRTVCWETSLRLLNRFRNDLKRQDLGDDKQGDPEVVTILKRATRDELGVILGEVEKFIEQMSELAEAGSGNSTQEVETEVRDILLHRGAISWSDEMVATLAKMIRSLIEGIESGETYEGSHHGIHLGTIGGIGVSASKYSRGQIRGLLVTAYGPAMYSREHGLTLWRGWEKVRLALAAIAPIVDEWNGAGVSEGASFVLDYDVGSSIRVVS